MAYLLIIMPLFMAGLAALIPSNRWRPILLPVTGVLHLFFTAWSLAHPALCKNTDWLILDPLGKIVLLVVSVLYFACSWYAIPYLRSCPERINRVFCICFLVFAGMASLLAWSHHLGLMWVAMEAVALVTAPLIYFNRSQLSIEAMWKYLLIGSVGIALALLGTFFFAYASLHAGLGATLSYDTLLRNAPLLSRPWLHAGFILLLVGYGTKMGLAPMHTWKPDAYGESPGIVGALFSGCITSCAFLTLLRVYHIGFAAGESAFISKFLIFMGLFSMAVAAVFMIRQRDIKRMLAYSSIEHMGILALGLGIGPPALFGTLLHIIANGLTKGAMFLSAGNIHRAFSSKRTDQVHGALKIVPVSAAVFLAGFIAITGSPPFAPFVSIFAIITGAFSSGHVVAGSLFLFFLLLVFIGMGSTVLTVVQGNPPDDIRNTPSFKDKAATSIPILGLIGIVVLLGIYIPGWLRQLLNDAVIFLGGNV
jgi:hydrogenase-4 component F